MPHSGRRGHRTAKMTANGVRLVTKPCLTCGEPFTIDPRRDVTAAHDCETGEWYVLSRTLAKAINAMSDDEIADWAGIDADTVRRARGR